MDQPPEPPPRSDSVPVPIPVDHGADPQNTSLESTTTYFTARPCELEVEDILSGEQNRVESYLGQVLTIHSPATKKDRSPTRPPGVYPGSAGALSLSIQQHGNHYLSPSEQNSPSGVHQNGNGVVRQSHPGAQLSSIDLRIKGLKG